MVIRLRNAQSGVLDPISPTPQDVSQGSLPLVTKRISGGERQMIDPADCSAKCLGCWSLGEGCEEQVMH